MLILSIWILGWGMQVFAGTLTIETETTVKVTGDQLSVNVTATNKGTSTSHNLQVHLICLNQRLKGPIKSQLQPGQSDTVSFEKTISGIKKGRYPLTVQVDFHDANQYPFSALSGRTFFYREDVNADLGTLGKDITITENGKLRFDVTNLGSEPRKVRASLILPKELSAPNSSIDFEIDARSKKNITFDVNNFSALKSSYPVFCYFEYDLKDTHYTNVARVVVTVTTKENWFRQTRWLWITISCILAAVFVFLLIKNRKGGHPSS